jgi:hypothetical protein
MMIVEIHGRLQEEEQCLCKSYRNNNGESDTVYRETGPYISLRLKFSHRELIG